MLKTKRDTLLIWIYIEHHGINLFTLLEHFRGIEPHIQGRKVHKVVVRDSRLRWPVPDDLPALLQGRKLLSVQRRAKYLLLRFSHGTVIMHLGMSGSMRMVAASEPVLKHDHVDIVMAGGQCLRFTDPSVCRGP